MENAYVRAPKEVLEHFNVSEPNGLTDATVDFHRQKYGKNGKVRNPRAHDNSSLMKLSSHPRRTANSTMAVGP